MVSKWADYDSSSGKVFRTEFKDKSPYFINSNWVFRWGCGPLRWSWVHQTTETRNWTSFVLWSGTVSSNFISVLLQNIKTLQVRLRGKFALSLLPPIASKHAHSYVQWISRRFPFGVRTEKLKLMLQNQTFMEFNVTILKSFADPEQLATFPSFITSHFKSGGILKNGEVEKFKGKSLLEILWYLFFSVKISRPQRSATWGATFDRWCSSTVDSSWSTYLLHQRWCWEYSKAV